MIEYEYKVAVQNYQEQRPQSVWSIRDSLGRGYETTGDGMGGARVYTEFPDLMINPKFRLPRSSRIFAAGSCFARNIEKALSNLNLSVLSWTPESGIGNEMFHRYNTFSILNDFYNALENKYDDRLCMKVREDRYIDYSGYGFGNTFTELKEKRQKVIDVHKNVRQADVVILTLGLVEAWYDQELERYLNVAPVEAFKKYPDRFLLRITDFEQNLAALQEFRRFMLSSSESEKKFVVTVSPVPFNATYSGKDVIVANCYSKSCLRSVAEAFANKFDDVDYFPSYEMVTLADPKYAWLPDNRHVNPEFVQKIMQIFKENYICEG